MQDLILTPSEFLAVANNALDISLGYCKIQGELSSFRISKKRWVYFDIKDEYSKISCFASVYNLPGPLEDGMIVVASGAARIHPQFGFSLTVQSISPAGEGTIKKALDLLKAKLHAEGLFIQERKRLLPYPPVNIALVTSVESAAYADFIKILQARWPYITVNVYDTLVQGEQAPSQLVKSIIAANSECTDSEVLVVIRGGGSADDLASFNDERVVRALAASRIPTLVAIGHEIDESLSELVADMRASTPSNAAELLAPDRKSEMKVISSLRNIIAERAASLFGYELASINQQRLLMQNYLKAIAETNNAAYKKYLDLLNAYNPNLVLKRGYSLVAKKDKVVTSVRQLAVADIVNISLKDGSIDAVINKVKKRSIGVDK